MDWTRTFNAYCERTDASFWSEPINAATNAAFLIAAIFMWRRHRDLPPARYLSAILFAIGLGSGLFHTFATAWASMLDTLPILVFAMSYIYLANRDFWGWQRWVSGLGTLAYLPYTTILASAFSALPFFSISAIYWPLPLLIAAYGALLRAVKPHLARNLLIGAAILSLSLIFRSLDQSICAALPFGTHFLWHILNAIMLAWMIETWARYKAKPA